MVNRPSFVQRHAVKLLALAAAVGLYGFARLPSLPQSEHDRLVSQFRFARFDLPLPPSTEERKTLRPVHPRLQRINAWISAVGAAIAATDLDGDGLPNDLCYVDNGTNEVVVTPAPGAERYPLFTLSPAPLPYQAATMAPMGCLPGDFNEDGHTDVLVYYWGRTPVVFLRNGSAGPLSAASFERAEISSSGETWYTNAATQADFDGDGHVDLVFGNYFPEGSGVIDAAATSDAEMQRSMSRADNGGKNRLLLWKSAQGGEHPAVAYQEIPGALPGRAEIGWTLAMGAADLDGDQLPELYVANDFGPDVLLHNRSKPGQVSLVKVEGRTGFAIPTSKVLGHDSFKGMGVDFADVNGDGLLDIYISNIASEYSLEESHLVWVSTGRVDDFARGIAPYVDKSEPLGLSRSGWGWDCRFADFNNDGILEAVQATGFLRGEVNKWPELHEVAMGNDQMLHHPWAWPALHPGDDLSGYQHNPFFVRSASGRFFDLAQELGMGQPVVTRAITIADVDGDGDLDFALGNQWDRSYFYRNDAPHPGAYLELELERTGKDGVPIPAIGAMAKVKLPDGRVLVGEADGGSGHSGKRSPVVHFGLGALPAGQTLDVEVAWRDARGVERRTFPLAAGRHTLVLDRTDAAQPAPSAGKES